jgi:hypothetical protein
VALNRSCKPEVTATVPASLCLLIGVEGRSNRTSIERGTILSRMTRARNSESDDTICCCSAAVSGTRRTRGVPVGVLSRESVIIRLSLTFYYRMNRSSIAYPRQLLLYLHNIAADPDLPPFFILAPFGELCTKSTAAYSIPNGAARQTVGSLILVGVPPEYR